MDSFTQDFIIKIFTKLEFIIQIIIAEIMCAKNFERRNKFALRACFSIVICLAASYLLLEYEWIWIEIRIIIALQFVFLFAMTIAALKFCYSTPIWSIMFNASAAYGIQHLGFNIRSIIDIIFFINRDIFWILETVAVFAAVYVILNFFFVRKMNYGGFTNLNNKKLIIVVGLSVLLCIFISVFASLVNSSGRLVFRFAMTIACFLLLSYQFSLLDNSYIQKENDTMQHILHKMREQYMMTRDNIELVNIKCHDIKQQIRLLSGKGKIDNESLVEIENIISIYDSTIKTRNEVLDVILTEKSLFCKQNHIKLGCMIDGEKLSIFKPMDIYSLFGNMIENAIEAVQKIGDPEKAFIGLTVKAENKLLIIHCENYFGGSIKFEGDLPVTTKDNTQYHGYGFKSIRHVVEKYGGNMSIVSNNEIFSINIIIPLEQ